MYSEWVDIYCDISVSFGGLWNVGQAAQLKRRKHTESNCVCVSIIGRMNSISLAKRL